VFQSLAQFSFSSTILNRLPTSVDMEHGKAGGGSVASLRIRSGVASVAGED